MWGRVVEFMLGCWLAISAFIFRYPKDWLFFWINDYVCTALIFFFSLICFYRPLRKMHLFNVLVGMYLIFLGYLFRNTPIYAPLQNYVVLGILFLMIGIIPTDAGKPTKPWDDFYHAIH